ncbi:hypothetical protein A3B32_00080 [Candidatus Uhrbacteria bacterium RIFCSPLOWO2_01_FULL_53_9]|uniref:DNA polymerase IV n=3 Tax=Candidatus Uhriibacteriota TaxID=1752732 RepID=A0A1F7UZ07_9BACT|nr:MAG: hypothetical protein A3C17_03230 [Candidatus Uhrbacteria bacterium RIFCSPHIGHO2_02_FULL_53_13]OGL83489.1 MAG: hypothetical protein A3B32_00080 [Candidatus Uhrbacteria bacterium RIFCSPLOWO2_01_FULL_53_9]OGL89200.1 MAG: hypothetical protein A3I45_01160 [Candidatus Uhrbacteria bacterium RIFCSPLOWO2_02_FULL_53_10]
MNTQTQQRILHVDFNSFFASAEQEANPFLRSKSVGVGGKVDSKGIVAAASYTAKARGIKTAMSVYEAKSIDPALLMVNGDSHKYGELSDRLHAILKRQGGIVERFSVDEDFLDVTHVANDWLDTLAVALRIRDAIEKEIGTFIKVSIGIGPNRLLAKMASDAEKPNGLTLVYPSQNERFDFLDTRALDDIPGIGPAILRHLKELGIESISDLRATKLPFLIQHFKQYGHFLYIASRGLDASVVSNEEPLEKSIGHSYTLPYHTHDRRIAARALLSLADRVGWRLRKRGLVARAHTAIVRFSDLRVVSKQGRLAAPTSDGFELYKAAWQQIVSIIDSEEADVPLDTCSIRLIGIVARDLVPLHNQISIDRQKQKRTDLLPWLDHIQRRYGARSWLRASLVSTVVKERVNGFKLDHNPPLT